jgi:amidase
MPLEEKGIHCCPLRCLSSVDLVTTYGQRFAEVHGTLHSVLELNSDALFQAANLDEERAHGVVRSPLHGLPVLVKDNIAIFDRMGTTAGSYALVGAKVPRDSYERTVPNPASL